MAIDDVYRLFGEASHWASILEEQLCNICALNERVINQEKYSSENVRSIVERFGALPIGQLIGAIKKVLGKEYESKVDTIFKPALEKRNRLIHGFFIDHHAILKNEEGIPKAMDELNEIKNTIFLAADVATKICTSLTEHYVSATSGVAQPGSQAGLRE